jgi:hypothetical protein
MTGQERDHGEILSRVLHSTTDQVEPVGDGLAKIQARLAEPWLKRQWWLLRREFMVLGWVFALRCQSWFSVVSRRCQSWFSVVSRRCQSWFSAVRSRLAAGAGAGDGTAPEATADGDNGQLRSLRVLGSLAGRAPAKRPRKAGAPLRDAIGPAMAWFRPALAVAGAVVLVVVGVFALAKFQQTIGLTSGNSPGTSTSTQTGRPGSPNGTGGPAPSVTPSAPQGNATSARSSGSPRSKAVTSSQASQSPSPSPAAQNPTPSPTSPSPTPSPTSPSPTASPTSPSPTASPTTQAPMVTGSPAPSGP